VLYIVIGIATLLLFTLDWFNIMELSLLPADGCSAHKVDVMC